MRRHIKTSARVLLPRSPEVGLDGRLDQSRISGKAESTLLLHVCIDVLALPSSCTGAMDGVARGERVFTRGTRPRAFIIVDDAPVMILPEMAG